VLYDRLHTRDISAYGGVTTIMPKFAMIFMFFTMASVGLPATSGFVGEFLVLVGAFKANTYVALLAGTGLVLGASYMLWLFARVMMGEVTNSEVRTLPDVSAREVIIFIPIVFGVLWLGLYPNSFLTPMHNSVKQLLEQVEVLP
jgi:NADH-quinone oxidoreductase subunit M